MNICDLRPDEREQLRQAFIQAADDPEKQKDIFKPWADKGIPEAQYKMGEANLQLRRSGKNRRMAVEWMERAASNGSAQAMKFLADIYLQDEKQWKHFVRQDRNLGFSYLERAARRGCVSAMKAISYYEGAEAYLWAWRVEVLKGFVGNRKPFLKRLADSGKVSPIEIEDLLDTVFIYDFEIHSFGMESVSKPDTPKEMLLYAYPFAWALAPREDEKNIPGREVFADALLSYCDLRWEGQSMIPAVQKVQEKFQKALDVYGIWYCQIFLEEIHEFLMLHKLDEAFLKYSKNCDDVQLMATISELANQYCMAAQKIQSVGYRVFLDDPQQSQILSENSEYNKVLTWQAAGSGHLASQIAYGGCWRAFRNQGFYTSARKYLTDACSRGSVLAKIELFLLNEKTRYGAPYQRFIETVYDNDINPSMK